MKRRFRVHGCPSHLLALLRKLATIFIIVFTLTISITITITTTLTELLKRLGNSRNGLSKSSSNRFGTKARNDTVEMLSFFLPPLFYFPFSFNTQSLYTSCSFPSHLLLQVYIYTILMPRLICSKKHVMFVTILNKTTYALLAHAWTRSEY